MRNLSLLLLCVAFAETSLLFGQSPVGASQMPMTKGVSSADSRPLSADLDNAFVRGRNFHALSVVTAHEVSDADQLARDKVGKAALNVLRPPRVGFVREIGLITPKHGGGGVSHNLPGPRKIWTTAVHSPTARALRVHFRQFDIGKANLLIYSRFHGRIVQRGVYTARGPNHNADFWSAMLPGDTVFLELSGEPAFEIDSIVHFDKLPALANPDSEANAQTSAAAATLGCHIEPACVLNPNPIHPAALDASVIIGSIITDEGTSTRAGIAKYCSGTVLEDLDNATQVPYLLTAFHCLSTQAEADSLEVIFRYQRDTCGGTLPNLFNLPFSVGAQLLQANPTDGGNDMAFLRLNPIQQLAPTDPPLQFAGWSIANGLTDPSYGVHHPGGGTYTIGGSDPSSHAKRVTFFEPSFYPFCPTIDSGIDGDYFLANATAGGTEGGSSGSGLFDSSGRVLGQLRGVCGPSVDPDDDEGHCNTEDGWRAVYGKFWVSYVIGGVGRWLEIGGTINIDRAFNGSELGTPAQPFNTVTEGYDLAWEDTRIKLKVGTYSDRLTLSKRVTLIADGGPVTIGQ